MSYLKRREPERLPLPSDPEYWVRMKPLAKQGDAEAAERAGMEVSLDVAEAARVAAGGAPNGRSVAATKLEWQAYQRTLALRLMVEWNLTDQEDQPLPIGEEAWAELEPEDALFLMREAQKRLRSRKPEEQRPFVKESSQLLRVTELETPRRRKR